MMKGGFAVSGLGGPYGRQSFCNGFSVSPLIDSLRDA